MNSAGVALLLSLFMVPFAPAQQPPSRNIPLPSGKMLRRKMPGSQSTNSFPTNVALSPDGKYLAILNNGRGTKESSYQQSIAILDTSTNTLRDFPDRRLLVGAHQTYFVGLAWSSDGRQLYASMASLTDPEGKKPGNTGNGIAVYTFAGGAITPSRFLKIPLQPLPEGKKFVYGARNVAEGMAIPFPAGIAVVRGTKGDQLLVANNLSDTIVLIDAQSGDLSRTFDVSTGSDIPNAFPYTCTVSELQTKAWCSLWNASQVISLDLEKGTITRIPVRPQRVVAKAGSHPTTLVEHGGFLYVALSNRDEIAVIRTDSNSVEEHIPTYLTDTAAGGSQPVSLAAHDNRLYFAAAGLDAVGVIDIPATATAAQPFPTRGVLGFIPTEWYPTALALKGSELFVATGKGIGTGPNSEKVEKSRGSAGKQHPYIASMIHGSIARVNTAEADKRLQSLTQEVLANNLMRQPPALKFADGKNPIKHVIYVIKENRTYDQVFGDLKPGNGDPSLTLYGWDVTPNQHKLALEFGVLDNFYDSGEVSGNGHVWSMAAITSDYTEKVWQVGAGYRGQERTYDFEGQVGDILPLEHNIADVNEPGTGYLWANAARTGITYRHYAEYVDTSWCKLPKMPAKELDPMASWMDCPHGIIHKGEPLPENVGEPHGSPSPFPWAVPRVAGNRPTKPELRDHFDPLYPDFRMEYPDQLRADEFLNEFAQFVKARQSGQGEELPQLIVLKLPNDHTSGTRPGLPTPSAAVADNDLALGRIVDAVSHSPYWDDTAMVVLEDDAQDGADHVDAHRSTALVISKYSPSSTQKPIVAHEFYTTVNMIRTIEVLLGLPPMNNNDAQAAPIQLFNATGHQPFTADYRNRETALIYRVNSPMAPGANESAAMDFSHPDQANPAKLNGILWRDRKGNTPMPRPKHVIRDDD